MKIALAQINPVIGDFAYNSSRIVEYAAAAKEQGCGLVIFSEMVLCGYPPQDLLERSAFLDDHDTAFADLLGRITGIGVICGIIGRHTGTSGKPLHNCAVLFEDGEVHFIARKRLLPTYDVFDETRYFEPGFASETTRYKGLHLALTVCEDIWNDKDAFPRPLYPADPVAEIAAAATAVGPKLNLLINISASPFHIGKDRQRYAIFSKKCEKYGIPLVYVNQVGGQDSLLFDGNSLVLDCQGRMVVQAAGFREDMVLCDTETLQKEQPHFRSVPDTVAAAGAPVATPATEAERIAPVYEALIMGVRDYVSKCGFSSGVLGLSGGIDSALTAAIACAALGTDNVLGIALPSPYTSQESIEDARILAANLGCRFEMIPIDLLFETYLATLAPLFAGRQVDVTEQNIQARIRGNLLMALSNKFHSLLLSTGNKSEMAVGYCTLYGDMSGGLAVIADVPKCLVYKLGRYINRQREVIPERVFTKPPSAELAHGQRDQDDLPPYEILDPILAAYLEENKGVAEIVDMGFERAVVEDVVRRIRINEYKRKQAPIGLKVTTKSFGYGRWYPTAQNYQERLRY